MPGSHNSDSLTIGIAQIAPIWLNREQNAFTGFTKITTE